MIRSFIVAACIALASCAGGVNPDGTTISANQQAITATVTSYNALDAAINAANAAVKAGTLKGQDARNTLDAFTKAKAGLDVALITLRAANTPAATGSKP